MLLKRNRYEKMSTIMYFSCRRKTSFGLLFKHVTIVCHSCVSDILNSADLFFFLSFFNRSLISCSFSSVNSKSFAHIEHDDEID